VDVHTFTKQAEELQRNVCLKDDDNCFLGQGKECLSTDSAVHATKDHNNVISVLKNPKNTAQSHSEQKVWNADIRCSAPS
jgi:hypothetical protein